MAPCIRWNLLVLVMSVFIVEGRARSLQNPVSSTLSEENTAALGNLLAKVVGQELDGCYLVVITAGVHQASNVFTPIVRSLAKGYLPGVLVDVSLTTPGRHPPLLHHLRKGDARFSCRVYLLDLISSNSMANENSDLLRYEVRTPWDDQWGVSQADGNWTGTVGTLQHHQADFSMLLSWLHSRMAAVDYSRVYVSEPLVIVTSKSGPLPQIFALVRPFPSVLWAAILILSMVVGLTMWALQRAWAWISGGQEMRVSSALMMSWGILLEDPPNVLPANVTSQVLVGWWWVFCMLITATYRSSLIAHLSVPDKSPTIDTLDQLLEEDGWTWGMEPTYGVGWEWFKESSVPTVQKVNQQIEVSERVVLGLGQLQGAFYLLILGYVAAAFTLLAETITNKFFRNAGQFPNTSLLPPLRR